MRINFGLAVLALIISLALWVLVVNDQNPERTDVPDISIPVEITKVPPGLVVMNNLDPVRFRIRAPKDKWNALRASSFRAQVDLSRLGPGIQSVPIVSEVSDSQIHVLEVLPATASVRLEEIQERTVPVKVNLVGNVPFGYLYGTPKADPAVVVASGPASLVQSAEAASVDVRLDGISVDIDTAFRPTPVDSSGTSVRNVRLAPQAVRVTLPVTQQVAYKQVGVRGAVTGTVAPGYWVESVSAEPTSVTVVGDPKLMANLNYVDTDPVSVEGATSSIVQDVRVLTPEGISLAQQQNVRLRVKVSPLQSSQSLRVAPRIVNVDPKLRVMSAPSTIEVMVQGPAPVMQGLRVESVVATIDASGLGEGTHSVKTGVSVPPGLSVGQVVPETATLVLSPVPTPTTQPTAGAPTPVPTTGTVVPAPTPSPTPAR